MFPRPHVTLLQILLTCLTCAPPVLCQGTLADAYARKQDIRGSAAQLDSHLTAILDAAKPNLYYASFAIPMPQPWVSMVPKDVYQLIIECHSGIRETWSPTCFTRYTHCYVEFVFVDGSRYGYNESSESTWCRNGPNSRSFQRSQFSDIGSPKNRTYVFRRQMRRFKPPVEDGFLQLIRARAGATADFRNRSGVPYISGDALEIRIAPTGVLDLRQNSAAAGHIFVTDGPALIRCDSVLMDPGVVLPDLFSPPPILQPAELVVEETGVLPKYIARRSMAPFTLPVRVHNTGNVDEQFMVSWGGAHTVPGQNVVMVPTGDIVTVPVNFQTTPGTPVGAVLQAKIQISSLTNPAVVRTETLHLAHEHPGQFRFGVSTPSGVGPLTADADGPVVAGGPTVQISSAGADPGAVGLAMFGVRAGFQYAPWTIPGEPAELYVDLAGPLFITVPLVADPAGTTRVPLKAPNDPGLRGLQLDYQSIHLLTSVQYPYRLCSSPALSLTVQ